MIFLVQFFYKHIKETAFAAYATNLYMRERKLMKPLKKIFFVLLMAGILTVPVLQVQATDNDIPVFLQLLHVR